jgi:hypothetical protein
MTFMNNFLNRFKLSINCVTMLLAALTVLSSCGEDRWPEFAAKTVRDQWLYDTMLENYLWSDEIPAEKKLNFFSVPSTFLQSIVYKTKDKSYSSVDTITDESDPSYGLTYSLVRNTANDTAYYALVTRVYPDSPASDAGVERGNWIMKVDDKVITSKNSKTLLDSGSAMRLTLGKYTTTTGEDGETVNNIVEIGTANVAATRPVDEDVIGIYTIVTTPKGMRVGYLVYNRFEAGTDADNEKYNNKLREASNYFAQQGISNLIVDLRYNSGGTFAESQLLASIIAPQSSVAASAPYAKLTYGDNRSADNRTLTYNNDIIGSGSNLNIKQGVFITSSQTSASVAGCFLNCISPLACWALVGSSVTCWGVATERIVSEELRWAIKPVVCTVTNNNDETGSGGSYTPNVSVSETSDYSRYLPLGNPNEALLLAAMQLIDGD